jgi:hypothetical protein
MNIWRRYPLGRNPYLRNAFRVARVPRGVVSHPKLVKLMGQTRRIADAGGHTIAGQPVSPADVNAAVSVLLDPRQRIAEELLEHTFEKPPLDALRKLARESAELLSNAGAGPLALKNTAMLRDLIWAFAAEFLAEHPGPDPSFGALELDLPPPFGRVEGKE